MANTAESKSNISTNSGYQSCIKIHGYRILPPLLDDAKREEMLYYKSLAIETEKALKELKLTRESTAESITDVDTYAGETDTSTTESLISFSDDTTYQVTFSETSNDVFHLLSESNRTIKKTTLVMPSSESSAITKVPSNDSGMEYNCDLSREEQLMEKNNVEMSKENVESDERSYEEVEKICKDTEKNYDAGENLEEVRKIYEHNGKNGEIIVENFDEITEEKCENSGKNCENQGKNFAVNNEEKLLIGEKGDTGENIEIVKNVVEGEKTPPSYFIMRQQSYTLENSKVFSAELLKQLVNVTSDSSSATTSEISFSGREIHQTNLEPVETPPKLVRSNSYVLDEPSPLLLAKIQQEANEKQDTTSPMSNKRKLWDLANAKKHWSSLEHNLNSNVSTTQQASRNSCTSLPGSSETSPDRNMSISSLSLSQSVPTKPVYKTFRAKISLESSDCHLSSVPTKHVPTPPTKRQTKIIRGFLTPVAPAEKELSPKRNIVSEPKKIVATFAETNNNLNKTDLMIKPRSLIKQRSLFQDDSDEHSSRSDTFTKSQPFVLNPVSVQEHIKDIIKKVQVEQSKQMSELIAKQKREQEFLMKTFADQQALLLSKLHTTYKSVSPSNEAETNSVINGHKTIEYNKPSLKDNELLKNSENILLECKQLLKESEANEDLDSGRTSSQTIFRQPLSPDDVRENLDAAAKALANDRFNSSLRSSDTISSTSMQYHSVSSSKCSKSFSEDSLEKSTSTLGSKQRGASVDSAANVDSGRRNSTRSKFPFTKQVWAATKICAMARGYLIRRLLKTERVQNLIQTIKDTLICAMELHNESSDNIQPADVELHRRLLLQVTAACCNFHDIFFSLSKAEQMSVISMDRERQKEKLLRPNSARSASSISVATQRALQRKLKKDSPEMVTPTTKKQQRTCLSARDFRSRAKSVELTETPKSKRSSPQGYVMRRTMSYGANRKPWR